MRNVLDEWLKRNGKERERGGERENSGEREPLLYPELAKYYRSRRSENDCNSSSTGSHVRELLSQCNVGRTQTDRFFFLFLFSFFSPSFLRLIIGENYSRGISRRLARWCTLFYLKGVEDPLSASVQMLACKYAIFSRVFLHRQYLSIYLTDHRQFVSGIFLLEIEYFSKGTGMERISRWSPIFGGVCFVCWPVESEKKKWKKKKIEKRRQTRQVDLSNYARESNTHTCTRT